MVDEKVIRQAIKFGMNRMAKMVLECLQGVDFDKAVDEALLWAELNEEEDNGRDKKRNKDH